MLSDQAMIKSGPLADFVRLNAPFGARCFLTDSHREVESHGYGPVLMHLLALGAF